MIGLVTTSFPALFINSFLRRGLKQRLKDYFGYEVGLVRILYFTCQNCGTVTMVKTCTWHLSENTQNAYAEVHASTVLILSVQQKRIRNSCYRGAPKAPESGPP